VPDWTTAASLATAGGTLVLALSTFAAVRSSNRAARVAERALLAGLRPLLVTSRIDEPAQKVHFVDGRWLVVGGGHASAEVGDGAIYLAISVRNAGSGLAVEHGWSLLLSSDPAAPHANPESFHRLTRDLYIAAGDLGFWQGALRDPSAPEFAAARRTIEAREPITLDILYGDQDGGQRCITRFRLTPYREDWLASVGRHWMLDRPQPR
jgi:hypothetical protein